MHSAKSRSPNRSQMSEHLEADLLRLIENGPTFGSENTYEMNVTVKPGKVKKERFDPNSDIFLVSGTGQVAKIKSQYCSVCEKDVGMKTDTYCDFCGSKACEICMHKMRRFFQVMKPEGTVID